MWLMKIMKGRRFLYRYKNILYINDKKRIKEGRSPKIAIIVILDETFMTINRAIIVKHKRYYLFRT